MTVNELIETLNTAPDSIDFNEVIETIGKHYQYTPARFHNGSRHDGVINEAGSNEGSCKIFAFAKLNALNKQQTLACFGKYYREDVLQHPDGQDHANIRNFMVHGWNGIRFEGTALTPVQTASAL